MKSKGTKKVARERIEELFKQAYEVFSDKKLGPSYSNRYIELARKIAMKHNIRFSSEQKKQFCKHCYTFLVPSINCRIRLNDSHVVYFCTKCKKYMRFPYIKEQKEKRRKAHEKQ